MTEATVEAEGSSPRPPGPRPAGAATTDATEDTSSSHGMGAAAPNYMSYSRMNSILTCGHQFYLERILKVPSNESWASVGGNAMHSAIEQMLLASLSTE